MYLALIKSIAYNIIKPIQKGGEKLSTIRDVAKLAGVSVGTVSRFLNGAELKEANRLNIEEAIKVLEFKPNAVARTLKTNKTYTIGVVIPYLSDIYSTTIVRNIEEELYENGYNIFVCDSSGDSKLEKQKVNILLDRMIDGLIVYPCSEDISYLNNVKEKHIPVITVDIMGKGFECDQVLTDNINATYTIAEWLINNNHKKIGIITGNMDLFTANERLKGYVRALEDYGIDIEDYFIKAKGFDEKSGYESFTELMKLPMPPTAIIACNYYNTLGAVKAMYDMNIKVPEQVSLVGFDNIGLSEIVKPALSIVVQPMEEVGKTAAQLMLRRIKGDYEDFPVITRLKTNFVIRQSTRKL